MGENYINFGMDNPEFYSLMFILGEPMNKLTEMGCDWKPGDAALARLEATVTECMEKGYLAKTDPKIVSLSVWSFVHGLVSLAECQRMEKLVPSEGLLRPILMQSLTWLLNNVDITEKKSTGRP
jgi:hypothetical protein